MEADPVLPLGMTAATFLLDAHGAFAGWSRAAEDLLGYTAEEVLGRPVDTVLGEAVRDLRHGGSEGGSCTLRHRDGRMVPVVLAPQSLARAAGETSRVVIVLDSGQFQRQATRASLLTGLFTQAPIALVLYDPEGRVFRVNSVLEKQIGLPEASMVGRKHWSELLPDGEVISPQHPGATLEGIIEGVQRSGAPVLDLRFRASTPADPRHHRVWSCSFFRLQDDAGQPLGVCGAGFDVTENYVAQQRLALLSRASGSIGQTLDVERTAADLVAVVVPDFADAAAVDVLAPVLEGGEPGPARSAAKPVLRRAAESGGPGVSTPVPAPAPLSVPPATVQRCLATGVPALLDERADCTRLVVPLCARGVPLGLAVFLRSAPFDPFGADDLALAEELASRTAACLDNARRFARERATALTLQRELLPQHFPPCSAVEIAHRYLPATGPSGVGGDWYEVIPLSGARVGLVVGDVAGHGINAAATMGRVRTTVNALARLDLAPEEVLARLDDFVAVGEGVAVSCLYAVYDPVTHQCVMARAGHPAPVVISPTGEVQFPELPTGPPLGLGGLPFESTGLDLPDGSVLALFTDGLIEARDRDPGHGLETLGEVLARPQRSQEDIEETCRQAVAALVPPEPEDDAALLLARVRGLHDGQVATWSLGTDHAEVSHARSLASHQLAKWDLEEAGFVVELVVSELVTNAMRYGGGPVHLRLIRDRALICEVSDTGHTSPHLRRAGNEDEGGRGLFLVAQLTSSWGTRYTPTGKIIWTEVPF